MDLGEMAADLGFEREEFLELVEIFVETAASDLMKLQSAIAEGDSRKVFEAAHSLRGSAGSFGFDDLKEEAGRVESNARTNTLEGGIEAANSMKHKLELIIAALRA